MCGQPATWGGSALSAAGDSGASYWSSGQLVALGVGCAAAGALLSAIASYAWGARMGARRSSAGFRQHGADTLVEVQGAKAAESI